MTEEIWLPIKGFEGLYEVSNIGRVQTVYTNYTIGTTKVNCSKRLLSIQCQKKNNRSRLTVRLGREKTCASYQLSRLVAEAFICPEKENYIVLFKDNNPENVIAENLIIKEVKYRFNTTKSLIGKRFGVVTVIERDDYKKVWKVVCDCGSQLYMSSRFIRKNEIRNCSPSCKFYQEQLNTPEQSLYGIYKRGAIKRKHSFKITMEQFNVFLYKNCFYCDGKPNNNLTVNNKTMRYNGIDRLDNKVGYEIDNCVSCCRFCNFAKRESSHKSFIEWAIRIAKNKDRLVYLLKKQLPLQM